MARRLQKLAQKLGPIRRLAEFGGDKLQAQFGALQQKAQSPRIVNVVANVRGKDDRDRMWRGRQGRAAPREDARRRGGGGFDEFAAIHFHSKTGRQCGSGQTFAASLILNLSNFHFPQKKRAKRRPPVHLVAMLELVNTRDPLSVESEVQAAYLEMFPHGDRAFIPAIFRWAVSWFSGQYRDYQAIDAHYHDLEHTLQGALCMARLLRGRHRQPAELPRLTQRMFELGLLAMLTHDTGYLKKRGDTGGTGAKYTLIHVDRSIAFAGELMSANHFPAPQILAVQNMIRCTGVNIKLDAIPFQNPLERIVGFALGAADLLGQMAAPDYVDKLPTLYSEFEEAARHSPDGKMKAGGFFASAEDLMQKTPLFWENYGRNKINREFLGLHRFLNDPYPDGPNDYLDRIESNIARLRRQLAAQGRV